MTSKKAAIGDTVKFTRFGHTFFGTVTIIREQSIIVKLEPSDADKLSLDTPFTVVSHKHYKVVFV
ncbi:DUF2187 family protein [Robertmurraya sp. FSL W8-0741]|uniref:DUF2187 family protein n=1 Tax=Robertmurraya TaxID=2837507 RepID=UPI001476CB88|nr:DUF2187 family protein [Robertmurraya siralis]